MPPSKGDDQLAGLLALEEDERQDGAEDAQKAPNGEGDGRDTGEGNAIADATTRRGPKPTKSVAPRAKTTSQRQVTKGGKAGNPGNFQGEPLLYLQGLLADYNTLQAQVEGRGKLDCLDAFWTRLRQGFWEKFKWQQFCDKFKETDEARLIDKVNNVSISRMIRQTKNSLRA